MYTRISTAANNKLISDRLSATQAQLYKTQAQIMAQKKILTPSDDPVGTSLVLKVNRALGNVESFNTNIQSLDNSITVNETVLSSVLEKLDRVNELAIAASTGTNSTKEIMQAFYDEVKSIKESLVLLANSKDKGQYVFSGANTALKTYTLNDDGSIQYNGTPSLQADGTAIAGAENQYAKKIEITEGSFMSVNFAGDSIFGFYDANTQEGTGLFKTISDLEAALDPDAFDQELIREQIDKIQSDIDHVSSYRTKNGVNQNRLEMTKNILGSSELLYESEKSNVMDLDLAEAYSKFVQDYAAYQASMQISNQILNTSMLDYIQ